MTRKKVNLAFITNDAERKASFKKRKMGLLKKVSELTTLCDVEACAIIYSPYDRQPVVWPNHEQAMTVIARFRSLSEMDQTRKMLNQDSFNRERIRKIEESSRKWLRDNRQKEMRIMMVRCMNGTMNVSELDPSIYHEMKQTIHNYLRDLQARYEKSPKGNGTKQVVGYDSVALPPLSALPAPSEYTPDPPPLDQFYNQFVPSGSELMPLTQSAGNQNYQFPSDFASGCAVNALHPPVNQGYKFTSGFASSAVPPPVNQEYYEQFTGTFDPESALVPIGSPYEPISHPQLLKVVELSQPAPINVVEPSQPQAPNVMEPPPLQAERGNMVEPTGGGEENYEACPWNLVESPKGGNNMVGGLGWEEVMVLPKPFFFDSDYYNPNSSVVTLSTYNHNAESSRLALGSGTESPLNSNSQVGFNQNSTFSNPSSLNTFGSSDVAPGSGCLLNQDSTSFNPSGSEVAPGSIENQSSTFIYPGSFNSSMDVDHESNLNPDSTSVDPSTFNPGTFDPSSSNVAPGSAVNLDSTFNPYAFDATLGSIVYPNSASTWIYDVAPGSALDPNSNFFNPSTLFPATFHPSNSTLASDSAPGYRSHPSTFQRSNSTADAAPGSSNN